MTTRRIPKATLPSSMAENPIAVAPAEAPTDQLKDFKEEKVNPEDIGAELLPILSKGLYTDPFAAIREYVQNAVDAGATLIRIKLTGNALSIRDDGAGMSYDDLVRARRFGVSQKNSKQDVGFRGIGIYSGYDLCDRLLLTTSTPGATFQSVLTFNFGAMKKKLQADKAAEISVTPLHELIQKHTRFRMNEPIVKAVPGTTVMLEDINPFHINRLRDASALEKYIIQNLPVDFDVAFEHRKTIKEFLKKNVPGYKSVRIQMEINQGESASVIRPTIPNLGTPDLRVLKSSKTGKTIAALWSCLYKGTEAKKSKIPSDFEDYQGFVYKVKGFTIGDNRKLKGYFKTGGGALYSWHTGEVYVIDDAIVPNTERNDFEASHEYEVLRAELTTTMEDIEKSANVFWAEERALAVLRKSQLRLAEIQDQLNKGLGDRLELFSQVEVVLSDLKKQKKKFSLEAKKDVAAAEKKTTDLRSLIRKLIDEPSKQRKTDKATSQGSDAGEQGTSDESGKSSSLSAIVETAGVELSPGAEKVLEAIDDALDSVLGKTSDEYLSILAQVESSLMRELAEE
jgi:hypothetical protein